MNKVSPIPVVASDAERWTPYRHPQPKDSPPELIVPNVIRRMSASGCRSTTMSGSAPSASA